MAGTTAGGKDLGAVGCMLLAVWAVVLLVYAFAAGQAPQVTPATVAYDVRLQQWVQGASSSASTVTIAPTYVYVDVAVGFEASGASGCGLWEGGWWSAATLSDDAASAAARASERPLPAATSLRLWPLARRSEVVLVCNGSEADATLVLAFRREQRSYMSLRPSHTRGAFSADDDASPGPYTPARYPSPAFETVRVSSLGAGRVEVSLDVTVVQRTIDGLDGDALVQARETWRSHSPGAAGGGWRTMIRVTTPELVPVVMYYGVGGLLGLAGAVVGAGTGALAVARTLAPPTAAAWRACNVRLARARSRARDEDLEGDNEEDARYEEGDNGKDDARDDDPRGDNEKDDARDDDPRGDNAKDDARDDDPRGDNEKDDARNDGELVGGFGGLEWRVCSLARADTFQGQDGRLCFGCPSRPWALASWLCAVGLSLLVLAQTIIVDLALTRSLALPNSAQSSYVGTAATWRSIVISCILESLTTLAGVALNCMSPATPAFFVTLLFFTLLPVTGGVPLVIFYAQSDPDWRNMYGLQTLGGGILSLAALVVLAALWASTVCAVDASVMQRRARLPHKRKLPCCSARAVGTRCADFCLACHLPLRRT